MYTNIYSSADISNISSAQIKKSTYKKGGLILIVALFVMITASGCGQGSSDSSTNTSSNTQQDQQSTETADYQTVTFDNLARTPDDFLKKKVTLSGKVDTIGYEGSDEVQCFFNIDGDMDSQILITYDPSIIDSRVLEGDYITVYGTSLGIVDYKLAIGGTLTIPGVALDKIEYPQT